MTCNNGDEKDGAKGADCAGIELKTPLGSEVLSLHAGHVFPASIFAVANFWFFVSLPISIEVN